MPKICAKNVEASCYAPSFPNGVFLKDFARKSFGNHITKIFTGQHTKTKKSPNSCKLNLNAQNICKYVASLHTPHKEFHKGFSKQNHLEVILPKYSWENTHERLENFLISKRLLNAQNMCKKGVSSCNPPPTPYGGFHKVFAKNNSQITSSKYSWVNHNHTRKTKKSPKSYEMALICPKYVQ